MPNVLHMVLPSIARLTTSDIQGHLEELYGVEVSPTIPPPVYRSGQATPVTLCDPFIVLQDVILS